MMQPQALGAYEESTGGDGPRGKGGNVIPKHLCLRKARSRGLSTESPKVSQAGHSEAGKFGMGRASPCGPGIAVFLLKINHLMEFGPTFRVERRNHLKVVNGGGGWGPSHGGHDEQMTYLIHD
jgi:hypothetical protein